VAKKCTRFQYTLWPRRSVVKKCARFPCAFQLPRSDPDLLDFSIFFSDTDRKWLKSKADFNIFFSDGPHAAKNCIADFSCHGGLWLKKYTGFQYNF
jgi:hypothetical protein